MTGEGDCYVVAAQIVDAADNPDLLLCHGVAIGQGDIQGMAFSHAWCELGDLVIDMSNGLNVRVLKAVYYMIGKINEATVRRYTPEQARAMLREQGHYGPWHDDGFAHSG